jgi:hypothetical protein
MGTAPAAPSPQKAPEIDYTVDYEEFLARTRQGTPERNVAPPPPPDDDPKPVKILLPKSLDALKRNRTKTATAPHVNMLTCEHENQSIKTIQKILKRRKRARATQPPFLLFFASKPSKRSRPTPSACFFLRSPPTIPKNRYRENAVSPPSTKC